MKTQLPQNPLKRHGQTPRVAIILCVLAIAPSPALSQFLELNTTTSAGYDDNVLARPGESQTLPSIQDGFIQITPELAGEIPRGRWRIEALARYTRNQYFSEEAGAYNRLLGQAALVCRLTPAIELGLDASAERLRRTEFDDLDVDRLDVAPRLEFHPSADLSVNLSSGLSRDRYPARTVPDSLRTGSDSLQTDRPLELTIDVALNSWEHFALSGGAAWLDTPSSQSVSEFDGYRLYAAATFEPGFEITSHLGVTYESREYNDFEVFRRRLMFFRRTRQDHSTEISFAAIRPLGSRVEARVDAGWFDYVSNFSGISYTESRIQAGFRVSLGSRGSGSVERLAGLDLKSHVLAPKLATSASNDGLRSVTFRCRAPGAARVSVAGTFNDWGVDANPLTDPDGDGVWEAILRLPPGLYRYMFLVDSTEWRKPEGAAAYEDDGFGQENGVLNVP